MGPSIAWDHWHEVASVLRISPLGLLCDLDGTLASIAPVSSQVAVAPGIRKALLVLRKRKLLLAVVSGRPARDAREKVGLRGLLYIGEHGEDWPGIARWPRARRTAVARWLHVLAAGAPELASVGVTIEPKRSGIAFHYRAAPDPERALEAVRNALERCPPAQGSHQLPGRRVLEIRFPGVRSKGDVVEMVVRRFGLRGALYLGDDMTDLPAFKAIRDLRARDACYGFAVVVLSTETAPEVAAAADFALEGVDDVQRFLERIEADYQASGD